MIITEYSQPLMLVITNNFHELLTGPNKFSVGRGLGPATGAFRAKPAQAPKMATRAPL